MGELVLNQRTLYFYYNPETMHAVTKTMNYSELSKMQVPINGCKNPKMAELVFNFYDQRVVSLLPETAVPLETKYRKAQQLFGDFEAIPEKTVKIFTIREPIWKDPRSVGLNYTEIANATEDIICVKIIYRMRKKNDELLYPDPFFMDREKALTFPIQTVSAGTKVTIIPIHEFRDRA